MNGRSNVRLLQAVALLSGLRFGLGVWVLYYLRLTDYAGIGLAETVTIVTAFAMEVPTGILGVSITSREATTPPLS